MTAAIKVLLIEDSPSDARIAAELLGEDAGFELTHVARLSEARARLDKGGFDAVLLDLMLPDSSGLATVSSVHDHAPDLPIIVYSGFGAEDVLFARAAVRGGAQDFLPKSLATPAAMRRAIVASIERKRLERFRVRHARHDPLTGLANRLLLAERFERAVARAERQGNRSDCSRSSRTIICARSSRWAARSATTCCARWPIGCRRTSAGRTPWRGCAITAS